MSLLTNRLSCVWLNLKSLLQLFQLTTLAYLNTIESNKLSYMVFGKFSFLQELYICKKLQNLPMVEVAHCPTKLQMLMIFQFPNLRSCRLAQNCLRLLMQFVWVIYYCSFFRSIFQKAKLWLRCNDMVISIGYVS